MLHDVLIIEGKPLSGRKWKETQRNHMPGGIKQFHYWLSLCPPSTSHQLLTHLHCTSFRTRWRRHCPRLSRTYSATTTDHRDAFHAPVQEAILKDICHALWYSAAKCEFGKKKEKSGLLLGSLSLLCPPALFLTCVLRLRNWKLRAQMTLHTPQADISFRAWFDIQHFMSAVTNVQIINRAFSLHLLGLVEKQFRAAIMWITEVCLLPRLLANRNPFSLWQQKPQQTRPLR